MKRILNPNLLQIKIDVQVLLSKNPRLKHSPQYSDLKNDVDSLMYYLKTLLYELQSKSYAKGQQELIKELIGLIQI